MDKEFNITDKGVSILYKYDDRIGYMVTFNDGIAYFKISYDHWNSFDNISYIPKDVLESSLELYSALADNPNATNTAKEALRASDERIVGTVLSISRDDI